MAMTHPDDRVQWLNDLIRLEIVLWDRIDAQLRHKHDLPLAYFQALTEISRASGGGLRVGDLAVQMRITVGGTSKLADRIESAGLVRRVADPADRRASRIVLTPAGRRVLTAATKTCSAEMASTVDPVLTGAQQRQMHTFVERLLAAATAEETAPAPKTARKVPVRARAPDPRGAGRGV
jgi:MarR family transcriptional regulator, organic hydroperoxide resistance regulator